jgi:hypothetical protein
MSIDQSDHYGQGMLLKRRSGRPAGTAIARVKRSKYSMEQRVEAIANGDADTLIAIAQEYAEREKFEMCAMCLKYAEQFTGIAIDLDYAPRKGARTNANV